jgi:valyl-tRNA synthetase
MLLKELGKTYDHQEIEKKTYEWWESNGYFRPEKQRELGIVTETSPRFCITIPPPNVTGVLHLGHAITLSIEDLMTRMERMFQKETLYLPGCDHAGIATQSVVERSLRKKGQSRKDLGRAKFVEKVWEWKHEYHKRITEQSKRLGISCDWSRERFTLDDNLSKAVRTAFVHLYKKGAIYRGKYMVNWCPGSCESAISDLEAEPEEIDSFLWYIKYPIITDSWTGPKNSWGSGKWTEGAKDFVTVATTRPETLLGDTAVAVAKNHSLYKGYVGKNAVLPGNNRPIPVIEDKYVDAEFGTGALKITPGHDPNDYEIGARHNLEVISVIDGQGKMASEHAVEYKGMDRFECRKKIVEDLKKEGILEKIEPYKQTIPHCQRCKTIIEPLISTQWFVRTKEIADAAIDAVRSGATTILPSREEDRYFNWMSNIRDWCISRQLWWGHRIPVWYCSKGHEICEMEDPSVCPQCGDKNLKQDEDVLDTWFSSGLWPFSTLGWPNTDHPDFKRFYPTDMRETGYDILFFWVAREMMLGNELTKQTPYRNVYLHGLVRNESGKKISKSMENIDEYDPLNIINKWGADSLRYTLISNAIAGKDINLNPKNVEGAHHFCNKIWQSTKYVLGHLKEGEIIPRIDTNYPKNLFKQADLWILSRLNRLIKTTTDNYQKSNFSAMARDIYGFYWDEFCDWYIESTKNRLYEEEEQDKLTPKAILLHILEVSYRLLHPIIPYLTENLWQVLPSNIRDGKALIVAKYPIAEEAFINQQIEEEFELTIKIIRGIRSISKDFNIKPGTKVPVEIVTETMLGAIKEGTANIIRLANVDPEKYKIHTKFDMPTHAGRLILSGATVYVPLEGLIDLKVEAERVKKQLQEIENYTLKIEKKLSGQFAARAPPELVEQEKAKLEESRARTNQLKEQLAILQ